MDLPGSLDVLVQDLPPAGAHVRGEREGTLLDTAGRHRLTLYLDGATAGCDGTYCRIVKGTLFDILFR